MTKETNQVSKVRTILLEIYESNLTEKSRKARIWIVKMRT